MQIIQKTLPHNLNYNFQDQYCPSDLLFFDIETTGLSADISSLYLIGCTYYKNNSWQLIQWFADDYISEESMLHAFFNFIKDYKVLIHYNGSGFDIPYLQKKCAMYNLPYNFSQIESLDLYKKLKPYKNLLQFTSLKLKSVESFLQIHRKDCYDGGELIEVYGNFIKGKFLRKPDIDTYFQCLILHNEEDITCLLSIVSVLSYVDLFEAEPIVSFVSYEENQLVIHLNLSNPIPLPITFAKDDIHLTATTHEAFLHINLYEGELKFFYPNYQDYFYLPKEDVAIHKSVAVYVDKEFRSKAKASTCYTKKNSTFLPQFDSSLTPCFKKEYKDKQGYIEVNDDFLHDQELQKQYIQTILSALLK